MPITGGGPNGPYGIVVPPPPPPPPITLYISPAALAAASDEQRLRIAEIELEFSHRVSKELAKAYAEVLSVLRARQDEAK
jgi:hypothetical protein